MRKTILFTAFTLLLFSNVTSAFPAKEGQIAIKGGIGHGTISWLGPLTTANFKLAAGGEYWFNQNWALGLKLG